MEIKTAKIRELVLKVLRKNGYDNKESEIIINSLLWAERRKSTQGLTKLFGWKFEKSTEAQSPVVSKSEDSLLVVDAQLNNHILACQLATKKLLTSVKNKPIFVAGIKNATNSAGALGYYTAQIATAGYVAIMMSAADPGVVAYGGKTAVFGTNPISIAVPTKGDPILLDMSTAALTWGDLVKYDHQSQLLPPGLAFDNQGRPTTDPKKAMDGSVTTFDKSYKSSGLALMIQILAGPLVGSLYSRNSNYCQYGSLIIGINPQSMGDKNLFIDRVSQMIQEIKTSNKAPGFDEILLPGERGYKESKKSIMSDTIDISLELYEKIIVK
ncbi:MAG: Ldh family oxidoreductase [Candidatus Shapirobacteria bacterium]|jgi:LDH2 family malate/lactate/ureidoglycolate dehydrogenase